MNKINECVKCGSLNLYFLPDNSALCIDCRAISNFIVEIDFGKKSSMIINVKQKYDKN